MSRFLNVACSPDGLSYRARTVLLLVVLSLTGAWSAPLGAVGFDVTVQTTDCSGDVGYASFNAGDLYKIQSGDCVDGLRGRDIGHGGLSTRAIEKILPEKEDFEYTIRLVSEVFESNGSSSMGTVCSCCLALMDGGVPIKAPVAGIAMGLVKEDDQVVILSDILGDEDHTGDMDFKVAGTRDGISALQRTTQGFPGNL